jgi:RNA polymerase sigma-70 factor (ECF subfamily)
MDLDDTVRDLAPRLLRYCLGQTGDAALAEEAAQEALTALVQRWRRQGPPECPEAFAFAIARRRAFRLSLKRRLLEPLQVLFDRHTPEPGPEERAVLRADHRRLLAALRRLAPGDREALLLVGVEGMELARGAEVLGVSLSAIKMRVHRARKRLARLLEAPETSETTGNTGGCA